MTQHSPHPGVGDHPRQHSKIARLERAVALFFALRDLSANHLEIDAGLWHKLSEALQAPILEER